MENKPYNERMKLSFSEQRDLFVCGLYYMGRKILVVKMHKIQSVKIEVCVGNTAHIFSTDSN